MTSSKVELFFSYSHKDEELRDELVKHLTILQRQGLISTWYDRRILAGENFSKKIDENIERAHIILLLISSDFLASEYCYEKELSRAMQRYELGEARVIPIILRDCDWEDASFSKLMALPEDGQAVTGEKWNNLDQAFTNIVKGIRRVVKELQSNSAIQKPIPSTTAIYDPKEATLANTKSFVDQTLRYYDYVSMAKVEMLFSQIAGMDQEMVEKLSYNFDTISRISEPKAKLRIVEEFLLNSEPVGSPDSPKRWIQGIVDARIVKIGPAIFYLAEHTDWVLALGGSAHHRTGAPVRQVKDSYSFTDDLIQSLLEIGEGKHIPYLNLSEEIISQGISCGVAQGFDAWMDIICNACRKARGRKQKISFLAKCLDSQIAENLTEGGELRRRCYASEISGKLITLATPLYVSYVD